MIPRIGSPPSATKAQGRLLFIDGLRGLASLLVIFFHLYYRATSPLHPALTRLPAALCWVLDRGWVGVEIFFVLSGFVIARSLLNSRITPAFLGRFAFRRSLRLDPPYWVLILLVVAMKWIATPRTHGHGWFTARGFSAADIATNFAYLHTLLGRPLILGVSWTLCLEIMFYLTYAVGLGVTQLVLSKGSSVRPAPWLLILIFAPTFLGSAWCWYLHRVGQNGHETGAHMYVGYWHMFLIGAALQWAISGWVAEWWFGLALLGMLAGVIHQIIYELHGGLAVAGLVVIATSVSIWLADRWNRWDDWLGNSFIQGVGRISYSLYLVHLPIFTVVLTLALKFFGQTAKACLVGIPIALLVTTISAIALHLLVEKPSMQLSRMFKTASSRANTPEPKPAQVSHAPIEATIQKPAQKPFLATDGRG